jgi:hypothetical protein
LQLLYTPSKQAELYLRYRTETKEGNASAALSEENAVTHQLVPLQKQDLRIQINYKINSAMTLRDRVETVWYNKNKDDSENGFLAFFDVLYKPLLKRYAAVLRWQYFETEGYNSRLYAYESDVLYSYSIPVFSGKGYAYNLTLNYDVSRKLSSWFRWSQVIYMGQDVIGLDDRSRGTKTEVKLQLRYIIAGAIASQGMPWFVR